MWRGLLRPALTIAGVGSVELRPPDFGESDFAIATKSTSSWSWFALFLSSHSPIPPFPTTVPLPHPIPPSLPPYLCWQVWHDFALLISKFSFSGLLLLARLKSSKIELSVSSAFLWLRPLFNPVILECPMMNKRAYFINVLSHYSHCTSSSKLVRRCPCVVAFKYLFKIAVIFYYYQSVQHILIKFFTMLLHDLLGLPSLMCLIRKVIKQWIVAATHTLHQLLKEGFLE